MVTFAGTDITSGIASCSAPVRYAGPDLPKAAVVGSCRDHAGNSAEAGHTFPFDASAPTLAKPKVSRGAGEITIAWPASNDFASTQIVRSPGLKGKASSIVYTGKASRFVDKSVQAGSRYRYQLVVEDLAGNKSGRVATAGPLAPLYLPAAGAALRAPPLLRWQAVAGAKFYNVQLLRNGVKVLSSWPRTAKLRLGRTWKYGGKRQRLVPGSYRWYVWGARGTRERPTYGRSPRFEHVQDQGVVGRARVAARAGSSLRLLCIPIGVLALVSLVLPKGAPGAPAPVSFTLTGTAGSNGWHTSNVTIRWTVEPTDLVDTSGCPAAELITAEGASTRQCIATFTWGTVTSPVVTVRIDKTPPTTPVANPARGPDSNGWYNRSVGVGFSATDSVSGMGSCTGGAYSGPDSATASVTGICTDVAGNTRAGAFSLQYDSTAPGVAAAASRAPDANGWYNRSLTVSFSQSPGDVSGARHAAARPPRTTGLTRPRRRCQAPAPTGPGTRARPSRSG